MILPRTAAIAEVGWSYGNKDYDDFSRRMHLLRKLYDKCGYKYAPYFFNGIE
jgi:hexosaminidase